jgi:plastocyanin
MNKKSLLIGILIIVVIIIGVIVWKDIKSAHTTATSGSSHREPLPKEVIITLTKNGFSPSQVTIKVGTAVRWKNESGSQQTVNSDNYPMNQLHRELNFGAFNNDSSVVYIFTKPGTYGFHNQFHHEQEGKITVVK